LIFRVYIVVRMCGRNEPFNGNSLLWERPSGKLIMDS